MYNYFMIIGKVENITKDTIDIVCNDEHLELRIDLISNFIDFIEVNQMIAVKGTIKEHGLFVDRIVDFGNRKEVLENE